MTNNQNIKIIRLKTGEDIIAVTQIENPDDVLIKLENPMSLIYKKTPMGSMMMLTPWIPSELIESDSVIIPGSNILTVMKPKEELIEYYFEMVKETFGEDTTLVEKLKKVVDKLDEMEEEYGINDSTEEEEQDKKIVLH